MLNVNKRFLIGKLSRLFKCSIRMANLYDHDKKKTFQVARNKASKNPASSRFDDANEGGGSGGEEEKVAEAKLSRFESRFEPSEKSKNNHRQEDDDDDDPEEEVGSGTPPVMEAVKSKEEILEEMGLNIRRLMTGLLLEVTFNSLQGFQMQNIVLVLTQVTAEELEETASSVLKKARNRTTAKPQLKTMLSG